MRTSCAPYGMQRAIKPNKEERGQNTLWWHQLVAAPWRGTGMEHVPPVILLIYK